MPEDETTTEEANFATFRECLSTIVIAQLSVPRGTETKKKRNKARRKTAIKPVKHEVTEEDDSNALGEDLTEFIEYLASDIFPSFPEVLRTITYSAVRNDATLAAKYETPIPLSTLEMIATSLPPSTIDSLQGCGMLPATVKDVHSDDTVQHHLINQILKPLLTTYITSAAAPPPSTQPQFSRSHTTCCEICSRDWLPLTYHHLIPRAVHAKVLKRGWHEEWQLNNVAWLCRACHSFVHSFASNEELAKEWYTVDLIAEREDVRRWANWVGKVRWKAR